MIYKMHAYLSFVSLLLILTGCATSQIGSSLKKEEKYYVILMGGQSNMEGVGNVRELRVATLPDNIHYANFGMSPDFSQDTMSFGPEVGLSRVLHQQFPDANFLLIKYAIGGASLLDWAPDYDSTEAVITGHPEFGNMYDSLWAKVDNITTGYVTETIAFLWMQGERDARIPEAGIDYYSHFKTFIEAIRQDAALLNLPIIFGLVNPDPERYTAVTTVQTAQRDIARTINNVWMIDTSDLGKWDDQVHYNTQGQLELGRRFGETLLEHWAKPSP
ncbi:MAG: sialate O-acetylesterase [Cyclobacteriaceae bacterium]